MRGKLSKAQRKDLEWFAAREFASTFGRGDPPLWRVKRLTADGLVAVVGNDSGRFGFTRFAITEAGRSAISKDEGEGA